MVGVSASRDRSIRDQVFDRLHKATVELGRADGVESRQVVALAQVVADLAMFNGLTFKERSEKP